MRKKDFSFIQSERNKKFLVVDPLKYETSLRIGDRSLDIARESNLLWI